MFHADVRPGSCSKAQTKSKASVRLIPHLAESALISSHGLRCDLSLSVIVADVLTCVSFPA